MALERPRLAEADMAQANRSPGEQRRETGKRKQPVKDGRASSRQVDVRKGTKGYNSQHGEQRAVGAIDVGEDLGGVALLSKGSQGARTAVDAGDAERQDGYENDDVHEGVETGQVGVLADQNEGGSVDVDEGVSAQKVVIVVGDEQADEEETEDVEKGDTPEDLLDGSGQGLDGVLGLSGGETDEFGSGEGEGRGDEAGAETTETVGEGTGAVPQLGTSVVIVAGTLGTAAEDHDEADDQEDDGGAKLEC